MHNTDNTQFTSPEMDTAPLEGIRPHVLPLEGDEAVLALNGLAARTIPGEPAVREEEHSTTNDTGETAGFDAPSHLRDLIAKAEELAHGPQINTYLDDVGREHLTQLKRVLDRESGRMFTDQRALAKAVTQVVSDRLKRAEQASPDQHHTNNSSGELQDDRSLASGFRDFNKRFYAGIDADLPPERVLGVKVLGAAEVERRTAELYAALLQYPPQKIELARTIIFRAADALRQRIKNEQREQVTTADQVAQPEVPIREPLPVTNERSSQRWVSSLREMRYANWQRFLSGLQERNGIEGVREWLLKTVNNLQARSSQETLTIEDFADVDLQSVHSQAASDVAGKDIARPVFMFKNDASMQHVMRKLLGSNGENTQALHLYMVVDEIAGGWKDPTGLIFSVEGRNDSTDHEIMHSIDPHVNERRGNDRIVSELVAYTTEALYHYDVSQLSGEQFVKALANLVGHRNYYEAYNGGTGSPIAYDDFRKLAEQAVGTMRELCNRLGNVEALRVAIQATTLDELFAAASARETPTYVDGN